MNGYGKKKEVEGRNERKKEPITQKRVRTSTGFFDFAIVGNFGNIFADAILYYYYYFYYYLPSSIV